MNLYKLHSDPESLNHYDVAHDNILFLLWDKYKKNLKELKKREDAIATSAEYSYLYALKVLKAPFPKGENAIAKSAHYSYYYAEEILNSRFPKGEEAIAKDLLYSFYYERNYLK